MSVHRVYLIMNWKLSWIILWYCRLEPTRAMPGFSCSDLQGRMLFRSAYDCHIAALHHTRRLSRRMMWWRLPRCPRGAASSCSWCRGRCPGSSSPPSARQTHLGTVFKNHKLSGETNRLCFCACFVGFPRWINACGFHTCLRLNSRLLRDHYA